MDAELKAKWVAALRSGKYAQGRAHLNLNGRYCCLGVLCEVADYRSASNAYIRRDEDTFDLLPEDVQSKLGGMNDTPISFAEIADYIERNL